MLFRALFFPSCLSLKFSVFVLKKECPRESPIRRLNKGYVLREKGKPDEGGEANGLEVLSAQVWACPHGRVFGEHGQQAGRPLLVVRPGEQ